MTAEFVAVNDVPVSRQRSLESLQRHAGELFLKALADPLTIELMLNPDGVLWQVLRPEKRRLPTLSLMLWCLDLLLNESLSSKIQEKYNVGREMWFFFTPRKQYP